MGAARAWIGAASCAQAPTLPAAMLHPIVGEGAARSRGGVGLLHRPQGARDHLPAEADLATRLGTV